MPERNGEVAPSGGNNNGISANGVGIQVPLLSPTSPPPLEVLPLIVNGPVSNRVDLVFFSDGCEYQKLPNLLS